MTLKKVAITCIFLSVCLLQACITDDYDLSKDINAGLSFSPDGFQLAGTSDVDVPMSQLIELKDSGELTVDTLTGNYLFYKKKDDMDTTIVCVGQGSLCNGTVDYFEYPFTDNPTVVFTPSKRYTDYGTLEFVSSLSPSYDPDQLEESIRELSYLSTNLDIDVSMNFSGIKGTDYFDEIKYEVPSFYVVENTSDLSEVGVKAEGLHTHTIHVIGVDFTRKGKDPNEYIGIDPKTHNLKMAGKVKVKGTAKTVKIDEYKASVSPRIDYRLIVGTLGTTNVTGRFNKREDVDIHPIEFHNLPDFLKDEEVVIDVDNPVVNLTLSNEVPTQVFLNAILKGIRDEKKISEVKIGKDYGTSAIAFDGPAFGVSKPVKTTLWVSRKPIDIPDTVKENIVIPEVMNLVRQMPDEIRVDAYAKTDSTKYITLDLNKEYRAVPRYELTVPLKMGKDMKIVYTKEFDDLHSKLRHLDLSNIVITANAVNHIPLDLNVKVLAYDSDGQEVEELTYKLPSKDDPIPGYGSKDINIEISGPSTSFQSVDRLILRFYALSSETLEGEYLNRNQNLYLSDIHVTFKTTDE